MSKWIWSILLTLAVGATAALAQTAPQPGPATATPREQPAAAATRTGEDDLRDFAAMDMDDQDLLADLLDGGPNEAPMQEAGGGMGGMRVGPDGPMGMHARRGGDGPREGMRGPGGMRGHWAMMAERLQLTDAQRDRIHAILEDQMRRGIRERADLRIATLDLHDLLRAENPNKTAIDAQVDKIARMRATLAKERIASMLQAHAVLTPEQRQKLRGMRMGGMGGPGGGPGGPPEGDMD